MSLPDTYHRPQRALPAVVTLSLSVGLIALSVMVYGLIRQPELPAERLMAIDAPAARAAQTEPGHRLRFLDEPIETLVPAEPQVTPEAPAPRPTVAPAAPKPQAPSLTPSQPPQGPTYNGRPIRPVRTVRMLVTAYSPDERSCGIHADGITASGYSVWTNGMKLVAADKKLPFGTIVSVPGYNGGRPVPVLDRGGKIKGNRLDVLYPTHEIARDWGVKRLEVTVWEYAD